MDPETLIECPYNRAHQILPHRMQTHLEKCRRSNPDSDKKICPFNATHHVNEPEFVYHLSICQSRGSFDQFKYTTNGTGEPSVPIPAVVLPPSTEDWESETKVPTYNPSEVIEGKSVISKLQGAKPSERKAHRMMQRQKFANEMK